VRRRRTVASIIHNGFATESALGKSNSLPPNACHVKLYRLQASNQSSGSLFEKMALNLPSFSSMKMLCSFDGSSGPVAKILTCMYPSFRSGIRTLPSRCSPYADLATRTATKSDGPKLASCWSLRAFAAAKYSGSCSGGTAFLVSVRVRMVWREA
jgi:hypothetical protein